MDNCPFCGGQRADCLYCDAERRRDEARQAREQERAQELRQQETPPAAPSPMESFSRPLVEQAQPAPPGKHKMSKFAKIGLTVLGYLFFSLLAMVILPVDASLVVISIAVLVVLPAVGLVSLWKKSRQLSDLAKVALSFLLGAVILFGILLAVLGPGN